MPRCLVVHDKELKALFYLDFRHAAVCSPGRRLPSLRLVARQSRCSSFVWGSQESNSEARIAFGSSTALLVVEVKPQNDY